MVTVSASRATPFGQDADGLRADHESSRPAIAWGPIIGGAFAAAALSLILMALGAGLGMAAASPWPSAASIKTFGIMTAVWLIVIHWLASGFGGYLAGRLRRGFVGLHSHEVFFRDTAHGFLTWALATVVATAAFASLGAATVGGGAAALSSAAGASEPADYFIDMLYRPPAAGTAAANAPSPELRAETGRILATDLKTGDVPERDRAYLAQLVATRIGLAQADARKRVDDVVGQIEASVAKARKAAAALSLFTALAMVIGAFIAAVAGALGGFHRDEWSKRLATIPDPTR